MRPVLKGTGRTHNGKKESNYIIFNIITFSIIIKKMSFIVEL